MGLEISPEICGVLLGDVLVKCIQSPVIWTPNLFGAYIKNQNCSTGLSRTNVQIMRLESM